MIMGWGGIIENVTYPPPDRLVADSEREPVVEILRRGFTDGRLTEGEFDERLNVALTARTHGELATVLAGLPEGEPRPRPPAPVEYPEEGRTTAAVAHSLGILTGFIGPLVVYLMNKNNGPAFARAQALEALNFQLTFLAVVLVTAGIGYLLVPVVWVLSVIAAVHAGSGQHYRYPVSLRFVK